MWASGFIQNWVLHTLHTVGNLCRAATFSHRSALYSMTQTVHGEHKRRRHILLTETAWSHLGDIAHNARLSNSETLERLVRSTPTWEGNATLADNAWEVCMDHTKEAVDPSDLFADESI